ncbi:4-hydroxyphenylacetate 3-hydroxylase N-terminal domain-containing protein [Thermoplasma sp.]|uniref:4-hydroxyphenylacetate 3-hydroxylase N-terminal domain-containing protein n=1 Tax=Thermoplasma sp. TaxID=1973142 RepID=UPI00127E1BA5|nr:4-hydroxyphenylacetate 3-hydroxylase N-terminal domain-containing protein [Thermoplasma sp.]KAA8922422.1 MAG: 4-hydroxybutyryl-CoA dehydratase [Thermoplasma sp.]
MTIYDVDRYLNSLDDGRAVYYRGQKVSNVVNHPEIGAAVKHASLVYKWQKDPKYRSMLVCRDKDYGEISTFYRIPKKPEDLMERFDLIYKTTRMGRGTFNIIQAIGSDALFALLIASREIDSKLGTAYHDRVEKFFRYVAEEDLALAVAQTDVKGDRILRPSEQSDPDMYVHIVKRTNEGIIVRGAKAHTTQGPVANEIIVLPTRAMTKDDADYAVAFAIPANAKGLKMISKPEKASEAALNDPWFIVGRENVETESITIFDDVFVPWDRVFLAGEWQYAGLIAVMFPTYHRFTAIAYRAGIADMLIGLGKLLAELNGVDDKSHIRRDIVEIIKYKELLRSTGYLAAHESKMDPATSIYVPNRVITNVGKLIANENYLDVVKHLVDVAGGLAATLPSSKDFENPDERKYLEKYLVGKKGTDAIVRSRILSMTKEIISSFGALFATAMIHAEGSIEASILELYRSYDYDGSKDLAFYASGIRDELRE